MMAKKMVFFSILLFVLFTGVSSSYASPCSSSSCDGYKIPQEAQEVISKGYENISINNYLGFNYLTATTKNETNKCSVLFEINDHSISSTPAIGLHEQICNISIQNNKIVSSWRDAGEWNDDVYQVNTDGKWVLLFRDSCVGCNQVKRIYISDGKVTDSILMADGKNFSERKALIGQITVDKAILFKKPSIDMKSKSYLVENDVVTLVDMSDDGDFYKINYKAASGKKIVSWIRSDDFSIQ